MGSVVVLSIVFLLGYLLCRCTSLHPVHFAMPMSSPQYLPTTRQSSLQFWASLRQPKSSSFSPPLLTETGRQRPPPTSDSPKAKQQGDHQSYYATSPPILSFSHQKYVLLRT